MSTFTIIVERTTLETLTVEIDMPSQRHAADFSQMIRDGQIYKDGNWLMVSRFAKVVSVKG